MESSEGQTDVPSAFRTRVRFTLIAAVHNTDGHLSDFIRSIEAQTLAAHQVQVVAVDDGSTDGSLTTLKQWSVRRPDLVTVVSKENDGSAAARNAGLDHAIGEWISFPDPDDVLDPDYLERVDAFVREHDEVAMVAANRLFEETGGQIVDTDPLRSRFHAGDRVVDADGFPEFFPSGVESSFFRAEVLRTRELRFDPRVRPTFDGGHFGCRYLLAANRPLIGVVQSAHYVSRGRPDGPPTLATALLDPDRFVASPRLGYLDVLRRAVSANGTAPEWLQNCVLYELSYYFAADARGTAAGPVAHGEVAQRFVETLGEIAALLTPNVIEAFGLRRFDSAWREILLHSFAAERWVTPYVAIRKTDLERNRIQIAYRYVGAAPDETITVRGRPFRPRHAKVRTHVYWDHPLLKERLGWVPAGGTLRVLLDGEPVTFRADWPGRTPTSLRPAQRARLLGGDAPAAPKALGVNARLIRAAARSRPARRVFGNAWVLVDRLHNADDNAERLFRHLRKRRRDVNAWFVLEKGTPDWQRLRADGYKRLVAPGSLRWKLLMLNCKHLISSHADYEVVTPPEIMALRPQPWRFTFLQHGVIKDDLSRWLNRKNIDLFVTSTPAEHESIVGEETPYAFTSYEVKRTGLPRFDRLREMGEQVAPSDRRYVLVCPTWRGWLTTDKRAGTQHRAIVDDFLDTEFATMWLAFLRDDRLRQLAEREQLTIGFLPHPGIQPVLDDLALPDHVRALRFAGQDVQRTFAEAAVVVTDYSSMAFNAAYIDRPVVYFQFDADLVHTGGHLGRYGYFDYTRDGFGPVASTVRDAADAVEAIVSRGRTPAPEYLDRIRAAFPDRDGRCCARAVAAIEALENRSK